MVFKTSQLHHHPGRPRKPRAEAERKRPPGQRKPKVPQQGEQTDGPGAAEALRLQKPLLFAQHLVPKCVFGYAGRAAPLSCEGPCSRSPAKEEHVHWQMQVLKELSWQRRKQKENEGKVTGPLSGMCPMPRALLERGWVSSELRWEQRRLEIRGRGATGTTSIIRVLAGRPQDYTPIHFLF